ncbi:MAG: PIN domain-containing protein [Nitrososphaerota archaeon]
MYLIDTNVFLEVMLSRERSEECKELLRMLKEGKLEGAITDFTIHAIIVLLDRFKKLNALKSFLQSLTVYKGLYIYTTSLHGEIKAVELATETGLDMDDAIQYYAALSVNAEAIVSYDKHFDNLKIPRREPKDIVESRPQKF